MEQARNLLNWEMVGIAFIVLAGSALHFAFAWSGYWKPVAIIAAVNESVWEHLKLAFWPSLFWSLFELGALTPLGWKFWSAKGYGLLVAPILIVTIFYGYTGLLGGNVLALDIATFVIAIALGQLVSAKLLGATTLSNVTRTIGIGLLFCQVAAYSTLTFYPPPFALFEDSRDGNRGIPIRSSRSNANGIEIAGRGDTLQLFGPRNRDGDG